jgi:hypothetical protein
VPTATPSRKTVTVASGSVVPRMIGWPSTSAPLPGEVMTGAPGGRALVKNEGRVAGTL